MSRIWNRAATAALIATVACVGFVPGGLAQTANAANPTIGRWKLNPEKSKNLAPTASTNVIRTFEDRGGGLILATVDGFAAGQPTFSQYAAKNDGKYYPYQTRGAATASSIAYLPTDNPRHYEWLIKVDGVPGNHGDTTVSGDGKTLTITNYTTRDGQPITVVSVFDRLQ